MESLIAKKLTVLTAKHTLHTLARTSARMLVSSSSFNYHTALQQQTNFALIRQRARYFSTNGGADEAK